MVGELPGGLASFDVLEELNLDGAAGVNGTLSPSFFALTTLRSVRLLGTGVSGAFSSLAASAATLEVL
jgi:hypothetical protein